MGRELCLNRECNRPGYSGWRGRDRCSQLPGSDTCRHVCAAARARWMHPKVAPMAQVDSRVRMQGSLRTQAHARRRSKMPRETATKSTFEERNASISPITSEGSGGREFTGCAATEPGSGGSVRFDRNILSPSFVPQRSRSSCSTNIPGARLKSNVRRINFVVQRCSSSKNRGRPGRGADAVPHSTANTQRKLCAGTRSSGRRQIGRTNRSIPFTQRKARSTSARLTRS